MIREDEFDMLISRFDVGTSTAEKDPLLPSAQIKTQEFYDIYFLDRIDIVRGIKGSGKTALYRVFSILKDDLKAENKIFSIFGIEASGDPVFVQFKSELSQLSALEFENFWTIYFLSLIRQELNNNGSLKSLISDKSLIDNFEKIWQTKNIPFANEKTGLHELIRNIINLFHRIKKIDPKLELCASPNGAIAATPGMGVEFEEDDISYKPKHVRDLIDAIINMLSANDIRIWIFLDRLDEVFPRRSTEEENGLKGLLKAAYNISCHELRIKIFLRDDIISQLASSKDGFTALTHVTDRASSTMTWTKDNLLLLIVKRICAIAKIRDYFSISDVKIENNAEYRKEIFYKIFPDKIGKYSTLDWLLSSCADGNGIVTPRDLIDLINFAKSIEYKDFSIRKGDRDRLLSEDSLKKAFEQLSIEKKNKFLMAEFPHMRSKILKLEGGYSIHNQSSLEALYQTDWKIVASDFISIGLFRHIPKKGQYKIPRIWMKGLSITQGKSFE
jgi:hypothetical protein